MISVSINGKDMSEVYSLTLATKNIAPPTPKTKYVDVPARNGAIDLTEAVTSSVKYEDRKITMSFIYKGTNITSVASNVYKEFHGKVCDVIFGDDLNFHYHGRISFTNLNAFLKYGKMTLEMEAEPFKLDNQSTLLDWEWDTFDFEESIINELGDLVVNGTREVTIVCRRAMEFPTFIASTAMTMEFNGVSYNLRQGEQKLYRVFFEEGNNTIKFTGNGTISINYIGGEL